MDRREQAKRLLEKGRFYLGCGLREDAIEVLTRALAQAPDDAGIKAALAEARGEPAAETPAAAPAAPRADGKGRVFTIAPRKARPTLDVMPEAGAPDDRMQAYRQAYQARDWAAAETAVRTLIEAAPDNARAWGSLALMLRRQYRFEEALAAHDESIGRAPDEPAVAAARAKTLWEAARYEEADRAFTDVLARYPQGTPQYADARMSRGMIRLTRGDLAAGLADYEWRWKTGEIDLPRVSQPYWDGAPVPGERILFYGEQGFGDAIQFARFVPRMAKCCAQVILPCKPALKRLMGSLAGAPLIQDQNLRRDAFDRFVPAISSWRVLDADAAAIPADVPYLAADPVDVDRFRDRIAAEAGANTLKVGLAWTGSPTNANDWKRAVDPEMFAAIVETPGVTCYGLQKVRDDTPPRFARVPAGVTDLSLDLNDFADTAAAIECLDLIITVDTAVAHLAGALARPVWVMLPFVPDWRWMLDREDSPWYPTMRLFRQDTPGDWPGVVRRVTAALADQRPPYSPGGRTRTGLLRRLWGRGA